MSDSPITDSPATPAQPAALELNDADLDLAVGGADQPHDLGRQEHSAKRSPDPT